MSGRIISWFSCGAASAVNTKKNIELHGNLVVPVYCNTLSAEHPDNVRFMAECEQWFGVKVIVISSTKYSSVDDVFDRRTYMSGIKGAICTTEMKKMPRLAWATPDDIHSFGFTCNEGKRIKDFEMRNPELHLLWTLKAHSVTKTECFKILHRAGIALPAMYALGYRNNNCIGCVKSSSPGYWAKIRKDFPDAFNRRCEQSRRIGCKLVEISHHKRIFLDELPNEDFPYKGENISCGPDCASPAKEGAL